MHIAINRSTDKYTLHTYTVHIYTVHIYVYIYR